MNWMLISTQGEVVVEVEVEVELGKKQKVIKIIDQWDVPNGRH